MSLREKFAFISGSIIFLLGITAILIGSGLIPPGELVNHTQLFFSLFAMILALAFVVQGRKYCLAGLIFMLLGIVWLIFWTANLNMQSH